MPETNFFWDPLADNILQERDETGAVTAEYTTEPALYGNLISQNRSGGVESQYHFDALGSTLALTDENQQVTDSYAYSAYGEVTEQTGSMINPFQYIGRKGYYRQFAAAEYFIRRRVFRSAQGRWLSGDPKALGWNYNYVNNRCCLLVDSSGEQVILPQLCVSKLRIVPGPKELGKLDCGKSPFQAWDFVVEFSSEDPKERDTAPCTGFIIQQVWWYCMARDCNGTLIGSEDFYYYEAWPVEKGSSLSSVRQGKGKSDFAAYDPRLPSQGVCHQHGEVRFYCEKSEEDPRAEYGLGVGTGKLVGWAPGRFGMPPCQVSSIKLPAIQFPPPPPERYPEGGTVEPAFPPRPPFWDASPPQYGFHGHSALAGPAYRRFSAQWCCCDTKDDFINAEADPSPVEDPKWSSEKLVLC